mmetsp:Transcript_59588/g.105868  ORF Transcript_59588/g.105868 Transcript_59588/m.105868 type:complete len:213 (-) Transcript_59588:120-758(-)
MDTHFFHNGKLIDADPFAPPKEKEVAMQETVEETNPLKMLGPTLLTRDGEKPIEEVLKGKKQVALLFAGQWCPWCRALDPLLKDLYGRLSASYPGDTEVVYISSDADAATFDQFTSSMPWPVMPFSRAQGEGQAPVGYVRKAKRDQGKPQGKLGAFFGMASVPQVKVLEANNGQVISERPMAEKGETSADGFVWSEMAPASWLSAAEPASKL